MLGLFVFFGFPLSLDQSAGFIIRGGVADLHQASVNHSLPVQLLLLPELALLVRQPFTLRFKFGFLSFLLSLLGSLPGLFLLFGPVCFFFLSADALVFLPLKSFFRLLFLAADLLLLLDLLSHG